MPDIKSLRDRLLSRSVNVDIWERIFSSDAFTDWAHEKAISKLYVHGAPQCGKTTFSAAVAERLSSAGIDQAPDGIVSIFLGPDEFVDNVVSFTDDSLAGHSFLRTVFHQLAGLGNEHEACPQEVSDLRLMIKTKCALFDWTYIIIDDLEACSTPSRLSLEQEISLLVDCGCSVMITNLSGLPLETLTEDECECCSDGMDRWWCCADCGMNLCELCVEDRDCIQLGHTMRGLPDKALALALDDDEMASFVDRELCLRLEQGDYDAELHERLRLQFKRASEVICKKSQGVLVICKALLDHLRDFQWAGYEEIMHVQTRVSRPEEEVFDTLLRKIKRQHPESVKMALIILKLASQVVPGSSMALKELKHAFRLACPRGEVLDQPNLYTLCQGTLEVREDDCVVLFHGDFGIYLRENCVEDFRHVNASLVDFAIHSLLELPLYAAWTADNEQDMRDAEAEQPLLGYAAPNWGHLLQESKAYRKFDEHQMPPVGSLIAQALLLLNSTRRLAICLYLANRNDQEFDLWPGCHALHVCAWFGLTKFVENLVISSDTAVDSKEPVYGRTPLMVAASRGQTAFATRLIKLGADVAAESEDGRSVFQEAIDHDAARKGYFDTTKLILRHWPSIGKAQALETTPLLACIRERNFEMLKFLTQHVRIDVNGQTFQGQTALMAAVVLEDGGIEVAELLLRHLDLRLDLQDSAGKTALHHAAQHLSGDAIESILKSSHCTPAVLDICDLSGCTAVMLLLRNERMCEENTLSALRCLSEAGADFRCIDTCGRGLLHSVAICEHASAVDYLHNEKGLPLDQKDSYGWCALHYASRTRSINTVRRLLSLGASSTLCDARGWSPVEIAQHHDPENETGINDLFSACNARSEPTAMIIRTPRPAWTCLTYNREQFQQLCVAATDEFWLPDPWCGDMVIHCAVAENNIPLCELLLERFDIDVINAHGLTSLFLAIDKHQTTGEHVDMIKFLLERGASLQAGISGLDALQTARQRTLWDLAVIFIEHGTLPLRYGIDFKDLFEAAALLANTAVIEKLRLSHLHPLRRHGKSRLTAIVRAPQMSEEIKEMVFGMEQSALGLIWPIDDE